MVQDAANAELFDLISEIQVDDGVCFDPDNVSLHGLYSDEISAHRAKRGWMAILEENFFLEPELDYQLKVSSDDHRGKFVLTCNFTSASARYAFWKVTNSQAPEAQFMIETAHVPDSESNQEALLKAGDLGSVKSVIESKLDQLDFESSKETISLLERVVSKLKDFVR